MERHIDGVVSEGLQGEVQMTFRTMIGYSKRGKGSCVNAILISPKCIQGGLRAQTEIFADVRCTCCVPGGSGGGS